MIVRSWCLCCVLSRLVWHLFGASGSYFCSLRAAGGRPGLNTVELVRLGGQRLFSGFHLWCPEIWFGCCLLFGCGSRACGCCFRFAVGVTACFVDGAGGVSGYSGVALELCPCPLRSAIHSHQQQLQRVGVIATSRWKPCTFRTLFAHWTRHALHSVPPTFPY